ncbi:Two component system response regulator, PAS domain-containing [Desulfonema limicola]|uniref:histidine kinase n=1 Tax=Desulfonema limicola TaxID=45656 RepID=A0A975B9M4_9BACT|nr:response regulator [Desulfonema limicola]QTA81110.1 Two component system response regulator, PAS domain-containing [Desulfonema limicola]
MTEISTKPCSISSETILIVDDDPSNLTILEALLKNEGYKVHKALNGYMALLSVLKTKPDLILLDIMMPVIDGFEVCRQLKNDKTTQNIPIIFLSALNDLNNKITAFSIGGVDYIIKPFQKQEVLARVQTHTTLCRLQKDLKNQNIQLHQKIIELKHTKEALSSERANLEIRVKERTKELDIYRKIVSSSNNFLAFLDTDYRYQCINETYLKHFKLHDKDITGKTPAVLFGQEVFNTIIKPNLDLCLSGQQVNYQFKNILSNGSYQVMDVFMRPYKDEDLQVTGCVVSARDITEQRQYEDMINQAYLELDQIFNSAGDGMYLIDKNFSIIRANSAFYKMWNFQKNQVLGKKCYELFSYNICQTSQCHFKKILSGEERLEFDYSAIIENGLKKFFSMTAAPFRDTHDTIQGIVVNVKDVTQKIASEKQEKIREQQMIQTEKLAAIGVLSAGIAHEINNPNGVIMLNVPMLFTYWKGIVPILNRHMELKGDFKSGNTLYSKLIERVPYLFEQTLESSVRIKKIVSELKDFARQDVLEMTEVNINKVLKAAVGLVSNKIKNTTNRFKVCYEKDSSLVKGNFQRLEQVFINILINACESLTNKNQGIFVNISSDKKKNTVKIQIQDQGAGIKTEDMHNLFNPFFTTKRDIGGTGLGLSVSHSIITEHRGTMTLESVPEQATVCTITLPLINQTINQEPCEQGAI